MFTRLAFSKNAGKIYALLYLHGKPMSADDIVKNLQIARSTFSIAIKELDGAGFLKKTSELGVRHDLFHVPNDPWEFIRSVLILRKRRDIDPFILEAREILDDCGDKALLEKITGMLEVQESISDFYAEILKLSKDRGKHLSKLSVEELEHSIDRHLKRNSKTK